MKRVRLGEQSLRESMGIADIKRIGQRLAVLGQIGAARGEGDAAGGTLDEAAVPADAAGGTQWPAAAVGRAQRDPGWAGPDCLGPREGGTRPNGGSGPGLLGLRGGGTVLAGAAVGTGRGGAGLACSSCSASAMR